MIDRKLALTLALCALLADSFTSVTRSAEMPENSWEQVPGGFAIAVVVCDNYVTVHLKNSSNSDLEIPGPWSDTIQLFYVDESGKQILVPRHRKEEFDDVDELKNNIDMRSPSLIPLPAVLGLWYPDDEWPLIETRPILCRISVYDDVTKQTFKVESSPKMHSVLVPGTSVFRAYDTGVIDGTFVLNDGNEISVACYPSNYPKERLKDYDISLFCPEKDAVPGLLSVKVRGGSYNKTFGGEFENTNRKASKVLLLEGPLPRHPLAIPPYVVILPEDISQMAAAHELVFEIEKFKSLILNDGQLAQIRALLAYVDKHPDPPPKLLPDGPGL
jgi:hypothetical protein